MSNFLSLILTFLFTGIAGIHFYWALGGKKWGNLAIPTQSDSPQIPLFKPRFIETIVVASGFLALVWAIGMKARWFALVWISETQLTYAIFGIALIFFARAIGEFKYVGFFKTIRNTPFSQMDTRYYSPLCLFIAIIALIINL